MARPIPWPDEWVRSAGALPPSSETVITSRARRAIEVYPHPATIALFRLGRTLKYTHKAGRPLSQLRAELLRLVRLLEGLADSPGPLRLDAHAGWKALVVEIESASRKSDLRRAEDQVDAVVCAYVAM